MSKAKGEVGFDADGERFTLTFSIDALCELEEAAGCSIAKIGATLADPDQPQLRIVKLSFWAALTEHHPDLTQKDASKLMASLGIFQASQLVFEAFALAFPGSANVPLDGTAKATSQPALTGTPLSGNG